VLAGRQILTVANIRFDAPAPLVAEWSEVAENKRLADTERRRPVSRTAAMSFRSTIGSELLRSREFS